MLLLLVSSGGAGSESFLLYINRKTHRLRCCGDPITAYTVINTYVDRDTVAMTTVKYINSSDVLTYTDYYRQ